MWDYNEIKSDSPWWYTPSSSTASISRQQLQQEDQQQPQGQRQQQQQQQLLETEKEWRPPGDYPCPGEPNHVFKDRMINLRRWLEARQEKVIFIVTHWGVAKSLTGLDFSNCEVKAVPFTSLLTDPVIDH
jgi:broad specificity phosphatase PhoE